MKLQTLLVFSIVLLIFVGVAVITFIGLMRLYGIVVPQDTGYTVYVPAKCQLQPVVAGEDYIFDCPKH